MWFIAFFVCNLRLRPISHFNSKKLIRSEKNWNIFWFPIFVIFVRVSYLIRNIPRYIYIRFNAFLNPFDTYRKWNFEKMTAKTLIKLTDQYNALSDSTRFITPARPSNKTPVTEKNARRHRRLGLRKLCIFLIVAGISSQFPVSP